MTKEQIYTAQMRELGIWQEAFAPLVKELSQAERQRTRALKAWSATAPPGGKPSFLDPHWEVICKLDQKILAYRETLGLTPKGLRKITGASEPAAPQDLISERLSAIAARVGAYGVDVSNLDHGKAAKDPSTPLRCAQDDRDAGGLPQSAAPTAPPEEEPKA